MPNFYSILKLPTNFHNKIIIKWKMGDPKEIDLLGQTKKEQFDFILSL